MRPWLRSMINVSIALGIVLGLFWLGAFRSLELTFARFVTPISQMLYGSSIYINPGLAVNNIGELIAKYNETEAKLATYQVESAQITDLQLENNTLREQLRFVSNREYQTVGGDVIGRQVDPSESSLILNIGTEQGIEVGMPVISGTGVLIGTTAEVAEVYTLVQLVTDAESAIAATINSEDKSIGVVNGGFGISVQMNLIPQNERIVPGDLVITSGLTEGIPRGLLIGAVDSVEREAYEPFQRAVITPPLRLDKVSTVSVIVSE